MQSLCLELMPHKDMTAAALRDLEMGGHVRLAGAHTFASTGAEVVVSRFCSVCRCVGVCVCGCVTPG